MKDIMRDIKLNILNKDVNVDIDVKRLPKLYTSIFQKKRLIKYLLNGNAILSGSRALSCYTLNGKQIFTRDLNDWDFIMTREEFTKLCNDFKIYDIDLNKDQYYLNRSFATVCLGYSDTNILPCHVQIIIKENQDNFTEKNGIKFSTFTDIIEHKSKIGGSKHRKDINKIYLKLKYENT